MAIAFLQPKITHYRREFYQLLRERVAVDLFTFADNEIHELKCHDGGLFHYRIPAVRMMAVPLYFPWKMLARKYRVWVIGGYWFHPATWALLLLGRLLGRRVVVWSHGISVTRYEEEYRHPPLKMKIIYRLASGAIFYTDKELRLWEKEMPGKPMESVGNTLGNVAALLESKVDDREHLKKKYHIDTQINFIFCARFNSPLRRPDLLVRLIELLPSFRFGFIIIGDGKYKPDFGKFGNVHDFGQLYDDSVKRELFSIADCYFQPAWLGLSIVEAMAYGLPICSLRRGRDVVQCVEYYYIEESGCGLLFDGIEEMRNRLLNMTCEDFRARGDLGREYVKKNLSIEHMVNKTVGVLGRLSPRDLLSSGSRTDTENGGRNDII